MSRQFPPPLPVRRPSRAPVEGNCPTKGWGKSALSSSSLPNGRSVLGVSTPLLRGALLRTEGPIHTGPGCQPWDQDLSAQALKGRFIPMWKRFDESPVDSLRSPCGQPSAVCFRFAAAQGSFVLGIEAAGLAPWADMSRAFGPHKPQPQRCRICCQRGVHCSFASSRLRLQTHIGLRARDGMRVCSRSREAAEEPRAGGDGSPMGEVSAKPARNVRSLPATATSPLCHSTTPRNRRTSPAGACDSRAVSFITRTAPIPSARGAHASRVLRSASCGTPLRRPNPTTAEQKLAGLAVESILHGVQNVGTECQLPVGIRFSPRYGSHRGNPFSPAPFKSLGRGTPNASPAFTHLTRTHFPFCAFYAFPSVETNQGAIPCKQQT